MLCSPAEFKRLSFMVLSNVDKRENNLKFSKICRKNALGLVKVIAAAVIFAYILFGNKRSIAVN